MRRKLRFQIIKTRAAQRENFHVAVPVRCQLAAAVLFEHRVKVGAAKAERTDARATRVAGTGQPRTLLGVDVKRRRLGIRCGTFKRLRDLDGRRQYFLMQGHRCLDDAGHACGCFGVANLRFH